jgi:hypothetical protein
MSLVLRQDRESLELREPPGAPAGVSGAYCDEGISDRTIRSFCEQDEGLIIGKPTLISLAPSSP